MLTCTFENGGKDSLRHVVVDTLIIDNNKVLLVKRAPQFLEGGKWGLVGGFMDRDETLEEAVHREVLEETGYKIADLKLLRVVDNPNRPREDRQNIVFVYTAKALEKISKPDAESTKIKWFNLNDLPNLKEIAFDHYKQIELYLRYQKKPFPLPIIGKKWYYN